MRFHVNFAKFSRKPISWKTTSLNGCFCITRLISTWNKFTCTQFLLIDLIWLGKKYQNKRNTFDSVTNSKQNSFWFLIICYSLDSPSCFLSDSNTSACTDHFCDITVSSIFILQLVFLKLNTNHQIGMGGLCLWKILWRTKITFILYLYLLWMFYYLEKHPACVSWIDSTLWRTHYNLIYLLLIKRKKRKKRKMDYWHKLYTNRNEVSNS